MPIYHYQIRTLRGELSTGVREAASEQELRAWLEQHGAVPIAVWEHRPTERGQVQLDERAADQLLRQVADAQVAGLPLHEALAAMAEATQDHRLAQALHLLAQRVASGMDWPTALHGLSIPAAHRAILQAAAETRRPCDTVLEAIDARQQIGELKRSIYSTLAYPTACMMLAMGLYGVIVPIVGAQVRMIEAGPGSPGSSGWLLPGRFGPWFVIGVTAFVLLLAPIVNWMCGPGRWRLLLMTLPGVGTLFQYATMIPMLRLTALLLRQQIPLERAVALALEGSGPAGRVPGAQKVVAVVANGGRLADALSRWGPFPRQAIPFVRWAELQGKLADGLENAAEYLAGAANVKAKNLRAVATVGAMMLIAFLGILLVADIVQPLVVLLGFLGAGGASDGSVVGAKFQWAPLLIEAAVKIPLFFVGLVCAWFARADYVLRGKRRWWQGFCWLIGWLLLSLFFLSLTMLSNGVASAGQSTPQPASGTIVVVGNLFLLFIGALLISWHRIRNSLRDMILWNVALSSQKQVPCSLSLGALVSDTFGIMGRRLRKAKDRIDLGRPVSESLGWLGLVRADTELAVAVGERIGALGECVSAVLRQHEQRRPIVESTLRLLCYLFIVALQLPIFIFMRVKVFVYPTIAHLYEEFEVRTPIKTSFGGLYDSVLADVWLACAMVFILIMILLTFAYHLGLFPIRWYPFSVLGTPLDRSRILELLGTSVRKGHDPAVLLNILAEVYPKYRWRTILRKAAQRVTEGEPWWQSLKKASILTRYHANWLSGMKDSDSIAWGCEEIARRVRQKYVYRLRILNNVVLGITVICGGLIVLLCGREILGSVSMLTQHGAQW